MEKYFIYSYIQKYMIRKMIIIICFMIIYCVFTSSFSAALNNSNYSESTPTYFVNTYYENLVVNKGSSMNFSIFIDGTGTPDNAYVLVRVPNELAEKNMNVTMITALKQTHYDIFQSPELDVIHYTMSTRSNINLPHFYFEKIPGTISNFGSAAFKMNEDSGVTNEAPIIINIHVKDNAKPGDYQVLFLLFYNQGPNIYYDEKSVNVHVKSWVEYELGGLMLIHAGAVAAIVGLYLNAFPFVYKVCEKPIAFTKAILKSVVCKFKAILTKRRADSKRGVRK